MQTIHMKCLDLFSLQNSMSSAAVVIGALWANAYVNVISVCQEQSRFFFLILGTCDCDEQRQR